MVDARLMSIGGFSLRSGLTVPALRYYDEIKLLEPASVDPSTGYRRYHPDQLDLARKIHVLRTVDLPIELVREVVDGTVSLSSAISAHRDRTARRTRMLGQIAVALDDDDNEVVGRYLDEFIRHEGAPMSQQTTSRPVQITIHADDLAQAVAFYGEVFGGEYREETSSFIFGTWKTDSYFRLCIEPQCPEGDYPGRNTCFTFLVDDLEETHRRAMAAGATEVHPPQDFDWKPQTSIVDDPSGNRIALSQA